MKALSQAFYTLFVSEPTEGVHNALFNDVAGRMFDTEADSGAEFPYIVFSIISDSFNPAFVQNYEDWLVQISLFSDKQWSTEVKDMYTHAKALFDNAVLGIEGATQIVIEREGASGPIKDDQGKWQIDIGYRVVTQT